MPAFVASLAIAGKLALAPERVTLALLVVMLTPEGKPRVAPTTNDPTSGAQVVSRNLKYRSREIQGAGIYLHRPGIIKRHAAEVAGAGARCLFEQSKVIDRGAILNDRRHWTRDLRCRSY